jgi:hypothetical protein
MTVDNRQAAQDRLAELMRLLQSTGDGRTAPIIAECESLSRAIAAFHMEGIRFRMYNVDRLLRSYTASLGSERGTTGAEEAPAVLEDVRRHLEAAGFHTRSHQAPV